MKLDTKATQPRTKSHFDVPPMLFISSLLSMLVSPKSCMISPKKIVQIGNSEPCTIAARTERIISNFSLRVVKRKRWKKPTGGTAGVEDVEEASDAEDVEEASEDGSGARRRRERKLRFFSARGAESGTSEESLEGGGIAGELCGEGKVWATSVSGEGQIESRLL